MNLLPPPRAGVTTRRPPPPTCVALRRVALCRVALHHYILPYPFLITYDIHECKSCQLFYIKYDELYNILYLINPAWAAQMRPPLVPPSPDGSDPGLDAPPTTHMIMVRVKIFLFLLDFTLQYTDIQV